MKKIAIVLATLIVALVGVILVQNYNNRAQKIIGYVTLPEILIQQKPGPRSNITRETRTFVHLPFSKFSANVYLDDSKYQLPWDTTVTNEDDGVKSTFKLDYQTSDKLLLIKRTVTYNGGYGRGLKVMPERVRYEVSKKVF